MELRAERRSVLKWMTQSWLNKTNMMEVVTAWTYPCDQRLPQLAFILTHNKFQRSVVGVGGGGGESGGGAKLGIRQMQQIDGQ